MGVNNIVAAFFNGFFEIHNSAGNAVYEFYVNYSRIILDYFHIFFKGTFHFLIYVTIGLTLFYLFMTVVTLFKKKRDERPLPEGEVPFVTIQIPTYNEPVALNCARKCLEFDYPKDRYEIIIGDDSSDNRISKKIDAFVAENPHLVKVTRRGNNIGFKPGNLNHMLKYTRGEFIVIFDSDFLPKRDFLRRIISPFLKDNEISVVQARWRIKNFTQNIFSILGGTITLLCHNIALPFISWGKGTSFLCGSAEAIRKKDLEELGGWQAGSLTEDIECSLRLIKKGKRLIYLEDLECECEAPFTLRDLCRQQMRWAYGVISALKLHFCDILKNRKNRLREKANVLIFASGYMIAVLLYGLTIFGVLSIISNRPAPIDWYLFLYETTKNILLTSGFLISSVIALTLGQRLKHIPKMVAGSLSVGLIVTFFVNVGIFKSLFNRNMQWFMLNKNGNA